MVVRYIVYVQDGETKSRALSETVTLEDTEKGGVVVTGITNPAINQKEGKELTCILYAASVIQQAKLNDINGFWINGFGLMDSVTYLIFSICLLKEISLLLQPFIWTTSVKLMC